MTDRATWQGDGGAQGAVRVAGGRVSAAGPVALFGGGPAPRSALDAALSRTVGAVAADGGLRHLSRLGLAPGAVIGDMDSVRGLEAVPPETVIALGGQDDTDFEKALTRIDAPLVIGAGFLGGRVDHELAALAALARLSPWPGRTSAPPCILVGGRDIVAALPPRLEMALPASTRVSLFPMAPVTGRSEGLRWPIDGLDLAPDGRIGTSNVATGQPVRLHIDAPGLLLILPARHLDTLIAAFRR